MFLSHLACCFFLLSFIFFFNTMKHTALSSSSDSVEKVPTLEKSDVKYFDNPSREIFLGNAIDFSGQYLINDKPKKRISVQLIDKLTNQVIGIDKTDSQGKYPVKWTPKKNRILPNSSLNL